MDHYESQVKMPERGRETRTYIDGGSTGSSDSSRGSTTMTGIAWETESSHVARSSKEEMRLSILKLDEVAGRSDVALSTWYLLGRGRVRARSMSGIGLRMSPKLSRCRVS